MFRSCCNSWPSTCVNRSFLSYNRFLVAYVVSWLNKLNSFTEQSTSQIFWQYNLSCKAHHAENSTRLSSKLGLHGGKFSAWRNFGTGMWEHNLVAVWSKERIVILLWYCFTKLVQRIFNCCSIQTVSLTLYSRHKRSAFALTTFPVAWIWYRFA